jgi:hypothetical protein
MATLRLLVPLTLALIVSLVPAAAEETGPTEPEIELEEVTAWFVCDGDTPEATVNQRLGNSTPTWGLDVPEGSFAQGAACGSGNPSVVNGTEQESPYDLSFAGEFTGRLDTITVDLHNAYLGTGRRDDFPQVIDVRLTIDGLSVFGVEERTGTDVDGGTFETVTHKQPAIRRMQLDPISEGLTDPAPRFRFSVTGIDYLTEDDDTTHRVVLTISTPVSGANRQNLWVWGASEVPSHITFNGELAPHVGHPEDDDRLAIPREEREPHDD